MRIQRLLLPTLALPLLVAFEPRGQHLGLHPEAGLAVEKSLATSSEMALDEMNITVNGQEIDSSMMSMEMSANQDLTVVVTDTYAAVAEGRPTTLRRSFDELGMKSHTSMSSSMPQIGDMDADVEGKSELEGLTVEFTWDADAEEYDVAFADGSDGDEELLEGLSADMDWTGFLPESEVSAGDTWEVPAEVFRGVLAPGGNLKIVADLSSVDPQFAAQADAPQLAKLIGELDGTVSCELVEIAEENGVHVARIKVDFDIESNVDLTEETQRRMDEMPRPDGMPFEIQVDSVDAELAYSGSGELLWNLDASVLHSLELSGQRRQVTDTATTMEGGGQSMEMENSTTLAGSMTVKVSFSVEG